MLPSTSPRISRSEEQAQVEKGGRLSDSDSSADTDDESEPSTISSSHGRAARSAFVGRQRRLGLWAAGAAAMTIGLWCCWRARPLGLAMLRSGEPGVSAGSSSSEAVSGAAGVEAVGSPRNVTALGGRGANASACAGAEDTETWEGGAHKHFQKYMSACGYQCVGGLPCAVRCVEKKAGLTHPCAKCFGGLSHCTATRCLWQCLAGNNPSCTSCVESTCKEDFEACSGLPLPGPDDG